MKNKKNRRFIDKVHSADFNTQKLSEFFKDKVGVKSEEPSMDFHETFQDNVLIGEGYFKLSYRDKKEEDWNVHYEEKNVITIHAKKLLSHLISEGCSSEQSGFVGLNKLRLGASFLPESHPEMTNPNQPNETDTQVVYTDYLYDINRGDKDVDGNDKFYVLNYINPPIDEGVTFEIFTEKGETVPEGYDKINYLSAGIFSNDLLFCTKTFKRIEASKDRELWVQWTITFRSGETQ